jgi:hypothetical protein
VVTILMSVLVATVRGSREAPAPCYVRALVARGAALDKLAATYLMLFVVLTDLGIVQNPMFGDGTPDGWAALLPGYGPVRLMVDGAYSAEFHAGGELLLSLAWVAVLGVTVYLLLRRALGAKNGHR